MRHLLHTRSPGNHGRLAWGVLIGFLWIAKGGGGGLPVAEPWPAQALAAQEPHLAASAANPTGFSAGLPHPEFWLPTLDGTAWYRPANLHGRPVLYLHFASWSPACRRLLPLWLPTLETARQKGQIEWVLVVHDLPGGPPQWFLRRHEIRGLVLHDPLHSLTPPELPWAVLVDAAGVVLKERVALNRLAIDLQELSAITPPPEQPAASRAATEPPDLQTLRARWETRRVPETVLDPAEIRWADTLLLAAKRADGALPDSQELGRAALGFYRRAWEATQDPAWAWRLANAERLQFAVSRGRDADAFERAQTWAERAGPSPGDDWRTRAWRSEFGPQIDKPDAAYEWLPAEWARDLVWTGSPGDTFLLAAQTGRPQSATAARAALLPRIDQRESSRADPLPWQAVDVRPLWVTAEAVVPRPNAAELAGSWARLYLQVHFKRGFQIAETTPQLDWSWDDLPPSRQPQWTAVSVSRAPDSPSGGGGEATVYWLEADVWWPTTDLALPESPPASQINPEWVAPPRRNATLQLRGREAADQSDRWRQIQFFLPPPSPQQD